MSGSTVMTRDEFAAAALTGLCSDTKANIALGNTQLAQDAYNIANAMLAARDTHSPQPAEHDSDTCNCCADATYWKEHHARVCTMNDALQAKLDARDGQGEREKRYVLQRELAAANTERDILRAELETVRARGLEQLEKDGGELERLRTRLRDTDEAEGTQEDLEDWLQDPSQKVVLTAPETRYMLAKLERQERLRQTRLRKKRQQAELIRRRHEALERRANTSRRPPLTKAQRRKVQIRRGKLV